MQFELDPALARRFIGLAPFGDFTPAELAAALQAQLPPELPTKPYAIIRAKINDGVPHIYILADPDTPVHRWVGGDLNGNSPWGWLAHTELPEQFTVISEGLDL